MPGGRVLCTSLFLPYTIDFQLAKDKKNRHGLPITPPSPRTALPPMAATAVIPNAGHVATDTQTPNLIASLQKHQVSARKNADAPSALPSSTKARDDDQLFDFKEPEKLVQPKSKAQREKDLSKRLPLLISTQQQQHHRRRKASIDSASAFDEAPWTVRPCIAGNIGLHNALLSVRDKLDKKCMWIGTLGMSTDSLSQKTRGDIRSTMVMEYDSYPVMSTDAEFEGHYDGYCKQVLWPHFHYVVQDDQQNMMYQEHTWKAYQSLNQRFADVIVENYQEGDISKQGWDSDAGSVEVDEEIDTLSAISLG
ncbi:glycosyltransferase family 20-domain-containing protein [Dichotomocladium elegans]|nr:glycosyltransferase family 20-domain-containing protein [Dichotomocladium elegans]